MNNRTKFTNFKSLIGEIFEEKAIIIFGLVVCLIGYMQMYVLGYINWVFIILGVLCLIANIVMAWDTWRQENDMYYRSMALAKIRSKDRIDRLNMIDSSIAISNHLKSDHINT